MFKITYDARHGKAYPDGALNEAVDYMICSGFGEITVSNGLFIDTVRARIKQGLLNHEDVVFLFEDYELYPDENGKFDQWPRGFCDRQDKLLTILLGWD